MVTKLGLDFVTDGRGDLHKTFGPEDVFHYAYAIFHSQTYRERYTEQLKIDFPRLPLTSDVELFRQLVIRGIDLVSLHLLEDDYFGSYWQRHKQQSPLTQPITRFVAGNNGARVGAVSKNKAYSPKLKRIYLDTSDIIDSSYFEFLDDINSRESQDTWECQIGGYQVLHKWLYDRRARGGEAGRILTEEDITHFQRTIVALNLTIKLMDEIDELIDEHSGFPLPGSGPEDADVQPVSEDTYSNHEAEEESIEDEEIMDEEKNNINDQDNNIYDKALAESTGVEYEGEDMMIHITEPFDPSQIRIEPKQQSLDTIIKRLELGEINLNPDFQRMAGIWNITKQSLLIELLMVRIPLPAFYMDASDDKNWLVIDGLQRLTTLNNFINEKDDKKRLKLSSLEFLGRQLNLDAPRHQRLDTWDKLPRDLQRRILETQITLFLVQPGTPPKVKFNIFKRINTGGVPLSGQEIRNALNQGKSTELLNELAESDSSTGYS